MHLRPDTLTHHQQHRRFAYLLSLVRDSDVQNLNLHFPSGFYRFDQKDVGHGHDLVRCLYVTALLPSKFRRFEQQTDVSSIGIGNIISPFLYKVHIVTGFFTLMSDLALTSRLNPLCTCRLSRRTRRRLTSSVLARSSSPIALRFSSSSLSASYSSARTKRRLVSVPPSPKRRRPRAISRLDPLKTIRRSKT